MQSNKLLYADLTFKIRGVLFKVHNKLGRYCSENQYCDLIEECLKEAGLKYEREKVLPKMFVSEREVGIKLNS